jgi:hypothetical protein
MANWPDYSPTRFKYLGVSRCAPTLWRFVCLDWNGGGTTPASPAVIGPQYRTKAEALGDLARYAESSYPELA